MNTVHPISLQELVNRFSTHIRKQGKLAIDWRESFLSSVPEAKYRASDGSMCGFGGLISDEHYNPYIEGVGVDSHYVCNALMDSGINVSEIEDDVLISLQETHDKLIEHSLTLGHGGHMELFEKNLKVFCKINDVQYPPK